MRLHRCAEVSCRELIKLGFDYCDKHYQQRMNDYHDRKSKAQALSARTLRGKHDVTERDREYNSEVRPELGHEFYQSKQWERISRYIKQRDMYVDAVDGMVYDQGNLIVDHIVPRRLLDTNAEQYDINNLWLLSRSHHNHKTAIEQKMNDNKLKHISRDWWIKVLKD
ncbi:HNH endonuclease [Leuconostoc gelidum subsp. gelidum]|uniref:HNH endonuclease n=1 Tax=Leuconostoc gelidum subsp. gelidum TaxID=1607839 RepID=A0ABS7V0W8_LEUGE|nr:HNH endonuclease signature motif containing protein [Leuconostoc gelidum]MBZ5977359.1 HNH endonuclease [Leuconostoc gelidum subsp. gelidum]MBZ5999012.1 HNH endonuclease [Leuconostoc gelidum subsp. gelidum]